MSSADTSTEEEVEETPAVDEARDALAASFSEALGDGVVETFVKPGCDVVVRVANEAWADAADASRNALGFKFFDFLSVIDWLPSPFGREMDAEQDWPATGREATDSEPLVQGYAGGDTRFQVFARVYSLYENIGVTLKVDIPDNTSSVASWTPFYAGANWHEREAHEMFGMIFEGHPGLRHIYLPGDFEGRPMRKDFPLVARRVKPWPGIVDVELLPGDDDAEGAES